MAGIIDAQSVRPAATVPAASRGYDGGKKVPGRKRHIATDTLGLVGRCQDYETLPATSEAMIRWSVVTRMSGRPVRPLAVGRH